MEDPLPWHVRLHKDYGHIIDAFWLAFCAIMVYQSEGISQLIFIFFCGIYLQSLFSNYFMRKRDKTIEELFVLINRYKKMVEKKNVLIHEMLETIKTRKKR